MSIVVLAAITDADDSTIALCKHENGSVGFVITGNDRETQAVSITDFNLLEEFAEALKFVAFFELTQEKS